MLGQLGGCLKSIEHFSNARNCHPRKQFRSWLRQQQQPAHQRQPRPQSAAHLREVAIILRGGDGGRKRAL